MQIVTLCLFLLLAVVISGMASRMLPSALPRPLVQIALGALIGMVAHVRVELDPENPRRVRRHEVYFQGEPPTGFGRLRETIMGPDGELYVTTSNCDGRGSCPEERDRILRITR